MCGITGVFHYNSGRGIDTARLAAMRNVLRHRGPDGEGTYINPDRRAGIASTRLAIRDLSTAGDQPFIEPARGVSIVFNGEIYNTDALRNELEARGVVFRSASDTEVLLRLYCEYGEALLEKINGIFAFAILDEQRDLLFLARDPLGVKPLYYADYAGTFAFASEAKALLKCEGLSRRLNEGGVASYLVFACSPGPETLFCNIRKLAPATFLKVSKRDGVEAHRYWTPLRPDLLECVSRATEKECAELVRDGVQRAVGLQLASDVTPTCSLSGGVDSSTVASLMSRFLPPPRTYFTIGFDTEWQQYNEFAYARDIARHAEAELVELRVSAQAVVEFMQERYAASCDDPNADPTCCLAYFLSQEMHRRGFKVALSGEGADEIFIGYERHLQDLAAWEGAQSSNDAAPDTWYWGNAVPFRAEALADVLAPEFASRYVDPVKLAEPVWRAHREALERLDRKDLPRRLSFVELQIRLPEILLMRVDKMSMANSVEYRVPFLDKELVELAFAIPTAVKLREGRPKSVLKDAVEGMIPHGNIHRKKMGFGLPLAEWLRDPHSAPQFLDLLTQSRMMKSGIVNPRAVRGLIAAHQSGAADWNFQLWTLLTFALWYDKWAA